TALDGERNATDEVEIEVEPMASEQGKRVTRARETASGLNETARTAGNHNRQQLRRGPERGRKPGKGEGERTGGSGRERVWTNERGHSHVRASAR
ncbi:hypothetical protein FRC08_013503, partial [Ceratobasidium sp. 394]